MSRPIQLRVYEADGVTPVGTAALVTDAGRSFLVDVRNRGTLGFDVPLDVGEAGQLSAGRIVRASIDGLDVGQWLVGTLDDTEADRSKRASGRIRALDLVDVAALLDDAIIYSELGLDVLSPGSRIFGPPSFDFDVSGWDNATELKRQGDAGGPWKGSPAKFVDPDAYWIGAPGDDTPPVDPGYRWTVKEFPVTGAQAGPIRFFLTADDGFLPFLDGDVKPGEQAAGLWGVTRYFDAEVDEGTHRLAVRVVNFERPNPDLNACGFILSGRVLLDGGAKLGDVVVRTDATWKILADPPTEPGMTSGQMLGIAIAEAQARGTLTALSTDFSDTLDSAGNPWADELDLGVEVGLSVTQLADKLNAEDAAEIAIGPGDLTVHAWNRRGTDKSATVSVDLAVDIADLKKTTIAPGKNVVVSRTAQGRFVETVDAASVALYGRREVFLSLSGAPSDAAADRQALAYLAQNAGGAVVLTNCRVEITDTSPIPFVDYGVGDDITVAGTVRRVLAIGVSEDAAGQPIYVLELGDRYVRSIEDRVISAISNMETGAAGGDFDAVGSDTTSSGDQLGTLGDASTSEQRYKFSHPGALFVTPESDATADEVVEAFDTALVTAHIVAAGSTDTVFTLYVEGEVVGGITVPAGANDAEVTIANFGASSGSWISVRTTTPGAGARTATIIIDPTVGEEPAVDGGTPGATGTTVYDGGAPTTTFTETLDGGTP